MKKKRVWSRPYSSIRPNGIDDVAHGFGHFLAAIEQEAVGIDPLGQRHTGRHKKSGPIDRVEADDVLADNMGGIGPVGLKLLAVHCWDSQAR